MLFAVLGPITFQVVGSPEQLNRKSGYDFPEQKVVEDKPRLQFIGDQCEEITLDCLFHSSFTNPATQRLAIYAAAELHQAMPLVLGNGEHWGYFVLTSIEETAKHLADDGSPISITMRLSLKEFVQVKAIDPNAPPTPDFTPLALVAPGQLQPGQSVAGTIITNPDTGAQVVVFQQPITGTSALVNNPPPTGPSGPNLMASDVPTGTITRMDPAAA